ncbi:MAG: DUF4988 and DUF4465 domain-containing protein [Bacteroidales bacterium]|nr:DUF4988 and DUF4465 domain-containing protein [Bacteroidales bacterium]
MCITLLLAGFMGCSEYDDSDLRNSVNSLEQKLKALEDKVNQMNSEIGAIQTIVNALNAGRVITGVTETPDGGYTITFDKGNPITIHQGVAGNDAPVIGVGEEGGVYYWTITSGDAVSWLTDAQGEKLPVSGRAPVMGVDADGYWTVNGVQVTGADGLPVKASGAAGESFFSDVSQDENAVTFTLANGAVIVIPKAENLTITTTAGKTLFLKYGETEEYPFTLSGTGSVVITKPDGWKAVLQGGKLSITAPPLANTYAEKDGDISITVVGKNATIIKTFAVSARDYNYVIDFEDPRVLDYLAGPTAGGENLYSYYTGDKYSNYDDAGSGLFMGLNYDPYYYDDYTFSGGGIAISQWNDMITPSYPNQCSVYYSDPVTGDGGYKGSKTFAVSYGYNEPRAMGDGRGIISFQNETQETDNECVFDHFYVTNNTYAALAMKNGEHPASAFTEGNWFKLVAEGFDKSGVSTGTVEFYLADFRTPTSPGIITEWTPVDLSPLGKVAEIKFDLQSNDIGTYGMNTPGYFCFDNLAIRQ